MYRAEVISPWRVVNGANRVALFEDYRGRVSGSDVTGQQNLVPDPNLLSVVIQCDQVTLDQVESDSDYEVLWSEEIDEGET